MYSTTTTTMMTSAVLLNSPTCALMMPTAHHHARQHKPLLSHPGEATTHQHRRLAGTSARHCMFFSNKSCAVATTALHCRPRSSQQQQREGMVVRASSAEISVSQKSKEAAVAAGPKDKAGREHVGYLWCLAPDAKWCAESTQQKKMCEFLEPVELTYMIDEKRAGPHQTGGVTIGRKADIQLFDATQMDERHAMFEEDGDTGHLFVTDLQSDLYKHSVNGTWVNKKKLLPETKTQLKPGDIISFGHEIAPEYVVLRNIYAHA